MPKDLFASQDLFANQPKDLFAGDANDSQRKLASQYKDYLTQFNLQPQTVHIPEYAGDTRAVSPKGSPLSYEDFEKKYFAENPTVANIARSGVEQGLNLLGMGGGMLVAPVGAALNKMNRPQDSFWDSYNKIQGAAGSLGTKLLEQTGQANEFTEKAREGVNKVLEAGMALGPMHIPTAGAMLPGARALTEGNISAVKNAGRDLFELAKNSREKEAPKGDLVSKLDNIEASKEQVKPIVTTPNILRVTKEGQAYDPSVEPFRQAALEKADLERRAQMSNESQQIPMFDHPEQGRIANPYEAFTGDWRVDENGIPIKADLSMDVQNAAEPLQRHLWGDELPPIRDPIGMHATLEDAARQAEQQYGQGGIPLTQAIDTMPWAQRSGAINRELKGSVEPSGALQGAIAEANSPFTGLGKGEAGAINLDILNPSFEKVKELGRGIRLVFRGDETSPEIRAIGPNGEQLGRLNLSPSNIYNPSKLDNLQANWVDTSGARNQGLSTEMYKFASEVGGDIKPAKIQTAEGRAMWNRFVQNGLATKGADGATINSGMASGQRGALDLHDVIEGLSKFGTRAMEGAERMAYGVRSSTDNRAIEKLYGTKIIERPQAVVDSLAKAQAEADGPKLFVGGQSGIGMASEKMKSTVVTSSANWMDWANRAGDASVNNIVRPLERTFGKLTRQDLSGVHEVFQHEMFNRKRYSEEALGQVFNPKQLEAYKQLRENFQKNFDYQNQIREKLGLEKFSEQDAYMTSSFNGDWHVAVHDKGGNLLWYAQNATKADAKKAVNWLQDHFKNNPDVDASSIKFEFKSHGTSIPRDTLGAWKDIMNALPDTPEKSALQEAYETWAKNQGTRLYRQDLHHVDKKANVRGFSGDQPWLDKNTNAEQWAKAQFKYLTDSMRWVPKQEALNNVVKFLNDETIQKNQPNNVALVKAYVMDNMGITKNIFKDAEASLAEGLGRSSVSPASAVSSLKSAFYAAKLWGSPGYAVATPLQAIQGSLAWAVMEHGKGHINLDMARFTKDLFGAMTKPVDSFGKEALAWAKDNQYINQALFDPDQVGGNKTINKIMSAGNATIALPDAWSRQVVFLPFARALWESGKFPTKEAAFDRAGKITEQVMVSMRREDRPLAVKNFGALGDAAWTLHAPVANMYNHLSIFGREAARGNPKPLITYLAAIGAMGGVFALPGMEEANKATGMFKTLLAYADPSTYEKVKDVDLKTWMLGHIPEQHVMAQLEGTDKAKALLAQTAYAGLPSVATGYNFASRFQNEMVDVENPVKGFSPLLQEAYEWLSLGKAAWKHNENAAGEAAYMFAPGPVARGQLENNWKVFQQGKREGDVVGFKKPSNLSDPSVNVYRTPEERSARNWGMTALSESIRSQKDYEASRETKRNKEATNHAFDLAWEAINGDRDPQTIARNMSTFIKLGGSLEGQIDRKAERLGLTPTEYMKAHADNLAKILQVARRVELDNGYKQ